MRITSTILSCLLCIAVGLNSLAQNKVAPKAKTGPKAEATKVSVKPAAAAAPQILINPQMLAFLNYSADQMKSLKKVDDFFYATSVCDAQCLEIHKKVAAVNSELSPADVILEALPKLKAGMEPKEYHGLLEALFAKDPSFQESLGIAFNQTYNIPEKFSDALKIAIDKGHLVN